MVANAKKDPPADGVREPAVAVPPKLRGLLHAGAFPVAVAAGAVLVALAPTWPARLAAAVYGLASAVLFGVSAAYHRSPLGSRRKAWLGRLDHMNILLLIASTYTPLRVLALRGWTRLSVLAVVWTGAAAGIVTKLIWRSAWRPAPRWVSTSLFIALGWVALFVLPQLLRSAGVLVLALILAGGSCTASVRSSTRGSGPIRHRGGSGSTRSSTQPPSWLTSPSTPRFHSSSTGELRQDPGSGSVRADRGDPRPFNADNSNYRNLCGSVTVPRDEPALHSR
jgi:hemolysin III